MCIEITAAQPQHRDGVVVHNFGVNTEKDWHIFQKLIIIPARKLDLFPCANSFFVRKIIFQFLRMKFLHLACAAIGQHQRANERWSQQTVVW